MLFYIPGHAAFAVTKAISPQRGLRCTQTTQDNQGRLTTEQEEVTEEGQQHAPFTVIPAQGLYARWCYKLLLLIYLHRIMGCDLLNKETVAWIANSGKSSQGI